jgi:hypothetical protein
MRIRSVVSAWVAGSAAGATTRRTRSGAASQVTAETRMMLAPERLSTTEASFQAVSSSPFPRKPENTGMNADPNAPAMMTRKSKSGMRKAET